MSAAPPPAVGAINHLTLAVRDVARAVTFYRDALGMTLRARWPRGAYLDADGSWLALVEDTELSGLPHAEYTHVAFSVRPDDFEALRERLLTAGARRWQENSTEGDSFYFLNPDGHRLEIHVGDLASRLRSAERDPWEGIEIL